MKKILFLLAVFFALFFVMQYSALAGLDDDLLRAAESDYDPNAHEIIELLISKGANVKTKNSYGETPLHRAISVFIRNPDGRLVCWDSTIKLLVEKGADVNARKNDGSTPLHMAVGKCQIEVLEFLIDKGADVNARNNDGKTAIDMAYPDVKEYLSKYGGMTKREALNQLTGEFSKSVYVDMDKRKHAIKLAQSLTPPPAVPEDARRYMAEGQAVLKIARDTSGYDEAAEKFIKASNLAPWWADTYFNLALVKEKQGKFPDAIESLRLYLVAAPGASDADAVSQKIYEIEYIEERKKEAEGHINRGADLFNSGDFQGCVMENKEAIRLYPEYDRAHTNLGAAYVKLERYQEAIPELKEAIRLGERMPNVYSNLGFAYKKLGDLKNAIIVLEEGVRESSILNNRGELHQRLGRYYDENGQYEKALEQFQLALKRADEWTWSDENRHEVNKEYVQDMINRLRGRLGK